MTITTLTVPENANKESITEFFGNLPPEFDRRFELYTTQLIEQHPEGSVLSVLEALLKDETADEKVRYAAFFSLCTYHRRYKEWRFVKRDLVKYEEAFELYATYDHLYSMYLKSTGKTSDLKEAVDRAAKARKKSPNHPGILHNYAEAIVAAIEKDQLGGRSIDAWIAEARTALREAFDIEDTYAKFYCTEGLIYCLEGNYDAARDSIHKAIDLESARKKDYAVRIGDYQLCLQKVLREESLTQIKNEQRIALEKVDTALKAVDAKFESQIQEMQGERIKSIEFVGFFAGVISLVIGGIQLAANQKPQDAAYLIAVFGGVQLIVFAGLSVLVHENGHYRRAIALFIFGLVTVVVVSLLMGTSLW